MKTRGEEALKKELAKLEAEAGEIRKKIDSSYTKMVESSSTEKLKRATVEKLKWEKESQRVTASAAVLNHLLSMREAQARAEIQLKEKQRKQTVFEKLKADLPVCPRCGTQGKFVEGLRQPTGVGNFWTDPVTKDNWKSWWVDMVCPIPNCRLRWHHYPDEAPAEPPGEKMRLIQTKDGPRLVKQ